MKDLLEKADRSELRSGSSGACATAGKKSSNRRRVTKKVRVMALLCLDALRGSKDYVESYTAGRGGE